MSHHLRRIRPDQLPRVRDEETLELRPASEDELLQHGLVPVGPDLYDCAHVDGAPEPSWGARVTDAAAARYAQLPPKLRGRVLQAEVFRAGAHALPADPARLADHQARRAAAGRPSRIRRELVAEAEVRPGDVALATGLVPNRFAGEASNPSPGRTP